MAFCSNCGNELRDGAKFCPKCGFRLNVPQTYTSYEVDDDDDEYEELSAGWKILIFLIFPIGFAVYNSNWENQPYKAHSAIIWTIYGWLAELVLNIVAYHYFFY